jgi:asparagine synthase (glutamine-hydrolysing)
MLQIRFMGTSSTSQDANLRAPRAGDPTPTAALSAARLHSRFARVGSSRTLARLGVCATDMCGIAGALAFTDDFAVDEATVRRMADTICHRGPDDAGALTLSPDRVALGHRRLSIIDLSAAGHQPMPNEDESVWITYNGEVYNHTALREELEARGHRYRSHTDTETIVHLYEDDGTACVERLEGMFAFAIWDARRRRLVLARDRLGVKPLYYARLRDGFVFGSEAKAVLEHPAVPRELDEQAFADYLTFGFAPAPRTTFRGISKLCPGERMVVTAEGVITSETWWNPMPSRALRERVAAMSPDDMVREVRGLLRESVGKRMMSDVPFGVFLSGGLDSSTNVALMAELSDTPVRTYSTAPRGHERYDELAYARIVARRFATEHHEVLVEEAAMRDFLSDLAFHQDEPLSDWTSIPQHFVTRLARETGTIVVQVGEGADEVFHGYQGYVDHRRIIAPFQRWVPQIIRRVVGAAAVEATTRLGRGIRHGEALYDAGYSRIPYWGGALCFRGPLKRRVIRTTYADALRTVESIWDEAQSQEGSADLFQRIAYLELRQRLPELLLQRLDRIAMASSVEGREPFLDHPLVEFVMALPPDMKYRSGQGKHALRAAVRDLLPREILDRPKQGFGTPMAEWLRGDFGRHARRAVHDSALRERQLLDYDVIDVLFAAHGRCHGDWSKHLWNLYCVSLWYDRWIARSDR